MKLEGQSPVGRDVSLRVSGDGRMLTSFKPKFSPQDHTIHLLQGNAFKPFPMHSSAEGLLTPGAEGRFTYTSRGVYTNAGTPVGKHGSTTDGSRFCVPAVEGEAFYLRINAPGFPKGDVKTAGRLYLHTWWATTANWPKSSRRRCRDAGLNASGEENYPTDKRAFPHPLGEVARYPLAQLRKSSSCTASMWIRFWRCRSRITSPCLSTPPECAVRGKPFTYAPVVKAKKGGVTIRLDSGPDGMKVTDAADWPTDLGRAQRFRGGRGPRHPHGPRRGWSGRFSYFAALDCRVKDYMPLGTTAFLFE